MSNRNLFGKASTNNSSGSRTRNFRLAEGNNVYRIAPAYGTLAASGKWFRFIKQHWGYKTAGEEGSPNGSPRLFVCPEDVDYKTKMIRTACPECSLISTTAANVENRVSKMREEGKSEDEINTLLGVQRQWLKEHNLDKKYIVIAKNEENEWGILWLPYKAKEALDNRRKQILAEEGYDILDADDGAWINFSRTGQGFKTTYAADVVSELIRTEDGKKARQTKQEALTDADFDSIVADVPDLTTVGRTLTADQIERLVESMGDPDVVEAIFGEGREVSPSPKKAAPAPKVAPKAAPAPVKAAPAADDAEEQAALEALAQIKARKAAKALAAQAENITVIPVRDADNMSDDEFMKVYAQRNG